MTARPESIFCGCDAGAASGGLIPVDAALAKGLALCWPVAGEEALALNDAHGRVLLRSLRNRAPLPPFDNSAMDGYALRLSDLTGEGPWDLPVAGRVAAGDPGTLPWPPATALRILTGAPIPPGCDAVVAQEVVTVPGPGAIRLDGRPPPGAHIRRAGEDLPAGAPLLPAGRRIDPRAAAVLAAAGQGRVVVRRRVQVALFSTGSELRAPGEKLAPGQIWNANRFHLTGALRQPWVDLLDLGTIPDDPEALLAALERAAYGADLVVTTGGVSVGDGDHMPHVLARAGGEVHAMKLALKPGKPLTIGRIGKAVYLGLPGNPVAAFVAWHVIGARLAEALAGMGPGSGGDSGPGLGGLRKSLVRAGFALERRPGRCEFLPARLAGHDGSGAERVEIVTRAVAHRLALLATADGLLRIPAETERIAPGDLMDFLPF